MAQRLFIAVEIEAALRERAAAIAGQVSHELGLGSRRAVTWVDPARMHLTVRFLGEVPAEVGEDAKRRLAEPLTTPAFRLGVSGLGAFPPSGPLRVIWLGIPEGQEALCRLHDEIEGRLAGLAIERDDRPFRAHLTLGRVRAPLGPAARAALARVRADSVGTCTIDHGVLFESRLSPAGPGYTALLRVPLAGRTRE